MNIASHGARVSSWALLALVSACTTTAQAPAVGPQASRALTTPASATGVPETYGLPAWTVGSCDLTQTECQLTVMFSIPDAGNECKISVVTMPGEAHRDIIEFHLKGGGHPKAMTEKISWVLGNGGVHLPSRTRFRFRPGEGVIILDKGRNGFFELGDEFDDDSATDTKHTKMPTRPRGRPFFYDVKLQYFDAAMNRWADCARKGPIIVNRG